MGRKARRVSVGWHRWVEGAVTVQPGLTDLSLCPSESPAASVRWKDSAVCFKAASWVFLDDRDSIVNLPFPHVEWSLCLSFSLG